LLLQVWWELILLIGLLREFLQLLACGLGFLGGLLQTLLGLLFQFTRLVEDFVVAQEGFLLAHFGFAGALVVEFDILRNALSQLVGVGLFRLLQDGLSDLLESLLAACLISFCSSRRSGSVIAKIWGKNCTNSVKATAPTNSFCHLPNRRRRMRFGSAFCSAFWRLQGGVSQTGARRRCVPSQSAGGL
jgi:hypothetical protein